MSGFGDYRTASRFRDLVTSIARTVVDRERPVDRLGKVYSYNPTSQTAKIYFPGDDFTSPDNLSTVRFARNMCPSLAMDGLLLDFDGDAEADIVRVAGKPGNLWIIDYFSGKPQTERGYVGLSRSSVALHSNPSFENWSTTSFREVGDANRAQPLGWSTFWAGASASFLPDRSPGNSIAGGTALKISGVQGTNFRINSDVFHAESRWVEFSFWAKCSHDFQNITVTMLTNTFLSNPEFFESGVKQFDHNVSVSRDWKRYKVKFKIPAGHGSGRFSLNPNGGTAGTTYTYWIDETESVLLGGHTFALDPTEKYTSTATTIGGVNLPTTNSTTFLDSWALSGSSYYGTMSGGVYTFTEPGEYDINSSITIGAGAQSRRAILLRKNTNTVIRQVDVGNGSTAQCTPQVVHTEAFVAGDTLTVCPYQQSGSALSLGAGPGHHLQITRRGNQ